jgi:hypothetical protein
VVQVLQRLAQMYSLFEHLPTLSKYTGLVSNTLRSRSSVSTVDRCPKPDMIEARQYFYTAFTRYLDRVHKAHYEVSTRIGTVALPRV